MSYKQTINDGLRTGIGWILCIGMLKIFTESYLFCYFKKKTSLRNSVLFSLATNLLSSIFIFTFLTQFVYLFRALAPLTKPIFPHFTDSFIFLPFAVSTIWIVNIACSLLLTKLFNFGLSLTQLLIIFTCSSASNAIISLVALQIYA